uniref:NADH:ubiquinone reductase (H(+)-translocating) n=1 Tax=Haemaphysalis danieli TaxID=2204308 RepID=A0A976MYM1_9ACAR|nr:NADH dehydrogenase subunit 5 [Haemaphysalis danieli]UNO54035.1 NADH dehydrogenase subunit 5 [Haemaphysalis danieli]
MFIKWSIILMILSILFLYNFMINIMTMNFMIIEYFLLSICNMDVKFYFLFDWISNLFISIVLFISSMVIWYSDSYMQMDKNKNSFCIIVLLFVMSMVILILMPNMLMIILGWDGLGLVSYCLVIFYQSVNSYNSGMMTIISNRIGDIMIIMSLFFFFNFGSFDLISVNNLEKIVGIFLIFAAMTKSAQIPFSAWLPAAMAAPTPVSSLVHSSTLVTAGVYLMIRFNYLFNINIYSIFLMKISLLTMMMAGLNAFFEMDLKKIIAFSTLSQLSMMMIILSMGMMEMAFFHLILHAIFKSMLFLCAGLIIHYMNGIQDIRMLSNFLSMTPMVMSCMFISILSLMGFPFIGGFYSKDLILEFFFLKINNLLLILMFLLGIIFTFMYCIRLLYLMILKKTFSVLYFSMNFDKKMLYPIFILTFILVVLGNFLFWSILFNFKLIFISYISKYLSLFMMLTMIYIMYYYFMSNIFFNMKLDFFFQMWFMSKITSMIFLMFNKNFIKMSMMDWKWMEMMGPNGVKNMMNNMSMFILWSNINKFNKIIILMLMMIVLMI